MAMAAARTLARLRLEPELVTATLIKWMDSEDRMLRLNAVKAVIPMRLQMSKASMPGDALPLGNGILPVRLPAPGSDVLIPKVIEKLDDPEEKVRLAAKLTLEIVAPNGWTNAAAERR